MVKHKQIKEQLKFIIQTLPRITLTLYLENEDPYNSNIRYAK